MPAETHSHRGPIDRDEVERIVREQLAEILEIDPDGVTADSRACATTSTPTTTRCSSSWKQSRASSASAWSGSRSTTRTSPSGSTVRDAVDCVAAGARRGRGGDRRDRHARPSAVEPDRGRRRRASTQLEAALGVRFNDRSLLLGSLAHRSWCAEHERSPSNERLEFLGDSVLGLVVTHYVFEHFPDLPEGQLSEVRAGVVNARVLAEVAQEIDLGPHLLLGKGEDAAGGRAKQSILADAFEAVVAAVYLDARSRDHARSRAAVPARAHHRGRRRARRPRLQDAPPGARGRAVDRAAPLRRARRRARPREALLRRRVLRRRVLRRGRRRIEEAGRAGRGLGRVDSRLQEATDGREQETGERGDGDAGAT